MAHVFGELRPNPTFGETQVLKALAALSDDYFVYPELRIADAHDSQPDFVVFGRALGLCVLSVKDWVDIVEADPLTFKVRSRDGKERCENHPLNDAKAAATTLAEKLGSDKRLLHASGPHCGKLVLPWTYAVVFANLTRLMIDWLLPVISSAHLLCADDLDGEPFDSRLRRLDWRFEPHLAPEQVQAVTAAIAPRLRRPERPLDAAQVDAVRGAIDPHLVITSAAGAEAGVLDLQQEKAAKEHIFEVAAPVEPELPQAGWQMAANLAVRLVRGVAGSGKTEVLAARAGYLAQMHPDWRLLVLAFNEPLARDLRRRLRYLGDQVQVTHFHMLCEQWLIAHDRWKSPISDSQGRIAHLLQTAFAGKTLPDAGFLAGEFAWMKDTGCITLDSYLSAERHGRRLRLGRETRQLIFQVFQAYQENLRRRLAIDWEDVPYNVLALIEDQKVTGSQFEAILVDEAQDFAPLWFQVLERILNPATGVLFLAADSTQRIYRKFTWRSLGIDVVGRSRILTRSYRSTYEIMHTAAELVRSNAALQSELRLEEVDLLSIALDERWMRRGDYPQLRHCLSLEEERAFMTAWVRQLLAAGYAPGDIAIFHRRNYGVQAILGALHAAGIPALHLRAEADDAGDQSVLVSTLHLAKGLEYRAVFISQLQKLYQSDQVLPARDHPAFAADETRVLYVGLTRARDHVCMAYEGKLPPELKGLQRFLSI